MNVSDNPRSWSKLPKSKYLYLNILPKKPKCTCVKGQLNPKYCRERFEDYNESRGRWIVRYICMQCGRTSGERITRRIYPKYWDGRYGWDAELRTDECSGNV